MIQWMIRPYIGVCMSMATRTVCCAVMLWGGAEAQEPGKRPERLFRSRAPLEMTIRAGFDEVFKDRDTLVDKPVPARLLYKDEDGGLVDLPIEVETRGHFRLRRTTCAFPPLKIRFDKDSARGTEFNDQGTLKLATHCRDHDTYEQNLLVEELAYRLYNQLTPLSHRTRLARIRYVFEPDTTKQIVRWGFFLEDDDDMGKRNGGKILMQTGGTFSHMVTEHIDLLSMFQYMIANTDWSVYAIHNIRLVDPGNGDYHPVAYDFDFSGLVDSPYAAPSELLPIRTVKARLYRGPCRKLDELLPVIGRFMAQRDSIYQLVRDQPGLEPKRSKKALDFLEDFFEEIAEPRKFDRALGYACR